MSDLTPYTFRVHWSAEDTEWVATCDQFTSLSCLADHPEGAFEGLLTLVEDAIGYIPDSVLPMIRNTPADDGCWRRTRLRGTPCPDGRVCPYDATDTLGLTALKSEVDALHARVEAIRERVIGPREPEDPCECGAMTAVNCGELPSLRHCGKWDE